MPFGGPIYLTMDESQIEDLQQVNWLAKADRQRSGLCYAIKDALLDEFGTHTGYCCQQFTKPSWDEFDEGGAIYSYHKHILEQINVRDVVFHRPTSEYYYADRNEHVKQSARFAELYKVCVDRIDGIKEAPNGFVRVAGIRALRRLVHGFFPLLRAKIEKPARTLYPFIKPRLWMDQSNGYFIRVPESVCVCSGCGLKLTLLLDRSDKPSNIEFGLFGPHPDRGLVVRCDTSVYRLSSECPEIFKERDYRGWSDPNRPWIREREISAHWARLLMPEYLEWKARQEIVLVTDYVGSE